MNQHCHHDHGELFHSHAPQNKMKFAFFLTLMIFAVEIIGGLASHSLALLSDSGHVLTDIAAIGLSWFAIKQSQKPANQNMTFGYYRAGILAALFNSIMLVLISVWILIESIHRFQQPQHVTPLWMFISAGIGLATNLYLGLSMHKDENINVRSAVLHMIGDAIASAGVIVGGVIISLTNWYMIDPVLSVLIGLFIATGACKIIKQVFEILMESTPKNIDFQQVVNQIKSIPEVISVHDIHVWTISTGKNALCCHVVFDGKITVSDIQKTLRDIEHRLIHLGIGHVTIQVEDNNHSHSDSELCVGINEHHHH